MIITWTNTNRVDADNDDNTIHIDFIFSVIIMITIVYAPTANSIPTPMHVAIEPLRLPPSPLTGPSASG